MSPASGPPMRRADAPGDEQPEDADRRAQEPARLEQAERQSLGERRGEKVEAAAVAVEIDEGQRALVGEAGRVERQQQVAVFRVRVVVPAEAVIAECQQRDERHRAEHRERDPVADAGRILRIGCHDRIIAPFVQRARPKTKAGHDAPLAAIIPAGG